MFQGEQAHIVGQQGQDSALLVAPGEILHLSVDPPDDVELADHLPGVGVGLLPAHKETAGISRQAKMLANGQTSHHPLLQAGRGQKGHAHIQEAPIGLMSHILSRNSQPPGVDALKAGANPHHDALAASF